MEIKARIIFNLFYYFLLGHVVYRAPDGTILRNTDDIVKYCTTDGQGSFFIPIFQAKIKEHANVACRVKST